MVSHRKVVDRFTVSCNPSIRELDHSDIVRSVSAPVSPSLSIAGWTFVARGRDILRILAGMNLWNMIRRALLPEVLLTVLRDTCRTIDVRSRILHRVASDCDTQALCTQTANKYSEREQALLGMLELKPKDHGMRLSFPATEVVLTVADPSTVCLTSLKLPWLTHTRPSLAIMRSS